ncbi:hypothetical protein C8J43_11032 [Sphingomonas sp. PP-CE-1G-424]|nr:hypothetical protein C8J43_11032 [Sphingomonas sp. PP-CE-1G-424]
MVQIYANGFPTITLITTVPSSFATISISVVFLAWPVRFVVHIEANNPD